MFLYIFLLCGVKISSFLPSYLGLFIEIGFQQMMTKIHVFLLFQVRFYAFKNILEIFPRKIQRLNHISLVILFLANSIKIRVVPSTDFSIDKNGLVAILKHE